MSRNYWQKFQDLLRQKAHRHAMYHNMQAFGKELGKSNQAIPKERIRDQLILCDFEDVDYILDGLFRGHQEGQKEWRKIILQEQLSKRVNTHRNIEEAFLPTPDR